MSRPPTTHSHAVERFTCVARHLQQHVPTGFVAAKLTDALPYPMISDISADYLCGSTPVA